MPKFIFFTRAVQGIFVDFGWINIAKAALILVLIIGIGSIIHSVDYEGFARWVDFNSDPNSPWYRGIWGYFLGGIIFTSIGGPRQALAFFAAYFFGFWQGLIVSTVATVCGCFIDAAFARLFETKVRYHLKGRVDLAFSVWREHPFIVSVALRLLPIGSNFLNNLAAGATGVALLPFVVGSAIGYVPQMVVFSLLGTGTELNSAWKLAMGAGLFIILMLFGGWLYRKYKHNLVKSA
ncbi:MAG: VTT domain-containing protein [Salaquimonas sp.]